MDKVEQAFDQLIENIETLSEYDIHQEINEVALEFNLDAAQSRELLDMYDDLPLRW